MEYSIYKKSNYDSQRNIFKFNYRSKNINDRRIEEDLFAFNILNDPKYIENIINVSRRVAKILLSSSWLISCKFYEIINYRIEYYNGSYPVFDKKFSSHYELVNFFNIENNHIRIMTVFWLLFSDFRTVILRELGVDNYLLQQFELLNKIYNDKIVNTKEFIIDDSLMKKSISNYDQFHFGSVNFIKVDDGFKNNFLPFARSRDYIKMKTSRFISRAADGKKIFNVNYSRYIRKNIPLVSGLSGMINLSCKSLVFMNSDFRSPQTIQMLESLCALIVATNMHSYYEVYDSLNLYLAKWKPKCGGL
ncbi:MAG: hypothetical protein DCC88_10605 [Spirobacillus cienkowskii]|jgi:hypothetical protein|uniref:Uncharacterized protein n=1 Tax=Spirobacillus cienkowskii TaxID=495820 RepID=A0A369KNB1_9BACT|nr:MAG: hypothetical protein DCC88_10605 [Spirobacillus cienkowskii]